MSDIQLMYKKETGFYISEIEVQGEVVNRGQFIKFPMDEFPVGAFEDENKYVKWLKLIDKDYLSWLESKVTELLNEKNNQVPH